MRLKTSMLTTPLLSSSSDLNQIQNTKHSFYGQHLANDNNKVDRCHYSTFANENKKFTSANQKHLLPSSNCACYYCSSLNQSTSLASSLEVDYSNNGQYYHQHYLVNNANIKSPLQATTGSLKNTYFIDKNNKNGNYFVCILFSPPSSPFQKIH